MSEKFLSGTKNLKKTNAIPLVRNKRVSYSLIRVGPDEILSKASNKLEFPFNIRCSYIHRNHMHLKPFPFIKKSINGCTHELID